MITNSKITSQTGINKSANQYVDANLFRGIVRLDDKNINQFNQQIGGFGFMFWVKTPPMFDKGNPELWSSFKNLTEKGHTTFDGIGNLTLETAEIQGGLNGRAIVMPSISREDSNTFSIQVYEMKGQPIKEALNWWITGISDPETAYRHYHGLIASGALESKPSNHTAELMYIQTDETGLKVEYCCYWTNVFPTTVDKASANISHGDHAYTQFTPEFSGRKYESKKINEVAADILTNHWKIEHYQEFSPENLKASNVK